MPRPSSADRWERVAIEKTKQVSALKMEVAALSEQAEVYRAGFRQLEAVMQFAGRVDYTGFVQRVKQELMKVKKWERTKSAHQHDGQQ